MNRNNDCTFRGCAVAANFKQPQKQMMTHLWRAVKPDPGNDTELYGMQETLRKTASLLKERFR